MCGGRLILGFAADSGRDAPQAVVAAPQAVVAAPQAVVAAPQAVVETTVARGAPSIDDGFLEMLEVPELMPEIEMPDWTFELDTFR